MNTEKIKHIITKAVTVVVCTVITIMIITATAAGFLYIVSGTDREIASLPERELVYRIYYGDGYTEKVIQVNDYRLSSSRGTNHLYGWINDGEGVFNAASCYCYESTSAPIRIMSFK